MKFNNITEFELSTVNGGITKATKKCLTGLGLNALKDAAAGGYTGSGVPGWGTIAGAIGGANVGLVAGAFGCYADYND